MAVKIDGQMGKTDVLHLNPYKLILNHADNTRWAPVSEEAVHDMALSFLEDGQKQPIRIRKIDGKGVTARHSVASGYTRTRAAILINEDPTMRERAGLGEDDIYTIQAIKITGNAEDALMENIVENVKRNELTYMDKAKIFSKLRERGWNDAEIGRKCNTPQPKVGQIIDFLSFSETIQERIHTGKLSWDAANNLILVPEGQREAVLEKAEQEFAAAVAAEEAAMSSTAQAAAAEAAAQAAMDEGENGGEAVATPPAEGEETPKATTAKKKAAPKKAAAKKKSAPKTPEQKERAQKVALTRAVKNTVREQGNAPAKAKKRTVKDMRDMLDQALSPDVTYGESESDDTQVKHLLATMLEWVEGDSSDDQFLTAVQDFVVN